MKKFLSFILSLSLLLSVSVCAFAVDPAEVSLDTIDMPKDVSVDAEDIKLDALIKLPEKLQAEAKKQVARLKSNGYSILSGFGVWIESEGKTYCTVKLAISDVPKGADIFVNGQAILPETKNGDGYYYFDVPLDTTPLKSVVLIAIRQTGPSAPTGFVPDYPSPNSVTP